MRGPGKCAVVNGPEESVSFGYCYFGTDEKNLLLGLRKFDVTQNLSSVMHSVKKDGERLEIGFRGKCHPH